MAVNHELVEEINQLQILFSVTTVYGQISSMFMNRARDSVLKSRDYLDELHRVFTTVFASYFDQVQRLARQKKLTRGGRITFLAHNGKKVAVLLSANAGFYGEIVKRTFDLFEKDVREQDLEVTIVGRQGRALFQSEFPNRPHTFFDFPDEHVDPNRINELIRHLVQYQEIRVYYGQFHNFLNQDPVVFTVSADPYQDLKQEQQNAKLKRYLFEPDIEHLLMFFEKQIFSSVFEQTIRESQLAKFASRIMVMDRAGENIRTRLKALNQEEHRIAHQVANQKQLNMFASISLWS